MTSDSAIDVPSPEGAKAQRDVLVEVLGILCHDLNNPLQSLVVLLELSADESPEGSDSRARAEQCQAAAERIRVLTAALTGLLREPMEDGPRNWARVEALLRRRFERSSVRLEADVSALAGIPLPRATCLMLCAAGLLALSSLPPSSGRGCVLDVRGEASEQRTGFSLSVQWPTKPADHAWNPEAASRLLAAATVETGLAVRITADAIFVEVAPQAATP